MPAPSKYTPRQKRLWKRIEHRLSQNSDVKSPQAVATSAVDKMIANRKEGNQNASA